MKSPQVRPPKAPKLRTPKLPKPQMGVGKARPGTLIRHLIPTQFRFFLAVLGTGSVASIAFFFGGKRAMLYVTIIVLIFAGLGALWKWFRSRREAKRSKQFDQSLKAAAGGQHVVGDPGEAARIDDLRQNFQKGIDTFREYGKDVYKLPWYVMVGESGAGKTEAIRHSSIRFPEALQDRFQGVGGTYSMHWWFSNQAVILDTAGAMLMGDESSKRFETFLSMLRTQRPDCPINGMILAIPVDSLLLDDEILADEKASAIANQLAMIQRTLELRFPIYLVITKADKISGFREFFDAMGNDRFARQMFGWSNPDNLDDPVDPKRIEHGLTQMLDRLRARRLSLLQDPISPNPTERRTDHVDSLYGLPESMRYVSKRLKRYLEILFANGEWSKLPPFFRGVYFTSSMREGSALDRELAAALAIDPAKLPEGGIWERERSFFLRDVFMEKMFHERGLVTRLKDTAAILRRRLTRFYATTAILLVLLLGIAWGVSLQIQKDLENEAYLWQTANRGWDNGTYAAVVEPIPGREEWRYRGQDNRELAGRQRTLVEYLKEMAEQTQRPLLSGWFFRPIPGYRQLEADRRQARRIVFEGSLIKPIVDAARAKLIGSADSEQPADQREIEAVAALIRLEGAWFNETRKETADSILEHIYRPLVRYVVPDRADPELDSAFLAAYGEKGLAFEERSWVSGQLNLDRNRAIAVGLNRFLGKKEMLDQGAQEAEARQADLLARARAFLQAEDHLLQLAGDRAEQSQAQAAWRQLVVAKASLDDFFGSGASADPTSEEGKSYQENLKRLREALGGLAQQRLEDHQNLFVQIERRLNEHEFDARLTEAPLMGEDEAVYNETLSSASETNQPLYALRYTHYEKSRLLGGDFSKANLIGSLSTAIAKIGELKKAGEPEMAYAGARAEHCAKVGSYLYSFADREPLASLLEIYRSNVLSQLNNNLRFPLVLDGTPFEEPQHLLDACAEIEKVILDLSSPEYQALIREPGLAAAVNELEPIQRAVTKLEGLMKVLQEAGKPKTVKILMGAVQIPSETEPPKPVPDPQNPTAPPVEVPQPKPPGVTGVSLFDRNDTELAIQEAPGSKAKELSELSVADGLRIDIYGFPKNSFEAQPVRLDTTGNAFQKLWGILEIVLKRGSPRTTSSQAVRVVVGGLSLSFQFSDLVPTVEGWPRRSDFGLK